MADAGAGVSNTIKVVVRCRPFNGRELAVGSEPCVEFEDCMISVEDPRGLVKKKQFSYDISFDLQSTQEDVFNRCGLPILENAFNAYNGCILAYGQTGSGKTHSTVGDVHSTENMGILPRACARLFDMIANRQKEEVGLQATVIATYLEIYNEKLKDLLRTTSPEGGKPQLHRTGTLTDVSDLGDVTLHTHPTMGCVVTGMMECAILECKDALELMDFGAKNRAVASTEMNASSSRSHAIFSLKISLKLGAGTLKSVQRQSSLHFVDLAGSERQKKTGAEGDRMKEGVAINQSLTSLGRVISQLTDQSSKKVTPAFRESKLTMFLKDALTGNSKTTLLACISPAKMNLEETIGTLEFASRCKLIKTAAKKNEESQLSLANVVKKMANEKAEIEAQMQKERQESETQIGKLQEMLATAIEQAASSKKAKMSVAVDKHKCEGELQRLNRELLEDETGMTARMSMASLASLELRDIEVGKELCVSEKATVNNGIVKGIARYVGMIDGKDGDWVGVALMEKVGKHNGSVNGKSYFACEDGYGIFIRIDGALPVSIVGNKHSPGDYRVLADMHMNLEAGIKSRQAAPLKRGMFVAVAEVRDIDGYTRGRIEEPSRGWVTISTTKGTQHWLIKEDDEIVNNKVRLKALHNTINKYTIQLRSIEEQENRAANVQSREKELQTKLAVEMKVRLEREQELLDQVEAVKAMMMTGSSSAMTPEESKKLRNTQHKQRLTQMSKMGLSCADIPDSDMQFAPRLLNLHPDPALNGCLVFMLPKGLSAVGSDPSCRVHLTGTLVAGKLCTISNSNNELLFLTPLDGCNIHVNGRLVEPSGLQLCNGDRLAFSHAWIFQVQIPKQSRTPGSFVCPDGEGFCEALKELRAQVEGDNNFQNCIEKALVLVKADFGSKASDVILKSAKRASEACEMANSTLRQMPKNWRGGVSHFELSILFDAHGLPQVCIVARRLLADDGEGPQALRAAVGGSAGIWEVEQFWQERLPAMFEALNESGVQGSLLPSQAPPLSAWEHRAWSEVPLDDFRRIARKNEKLQEQLDRCKNQIQARGDAAQPDSPTNRGGMLGRFMGVLGGGSSSKAAAPTSPRGSPRGNTTPRQGR